MPRLTGLHPNLSAFMDTLARSEGTAGKGDDGYNILVGGGQFGDYSKHPNILVDLPNLKIKSTAAGRYQLLHRYFAPYAQRLHLKNFSPESQDKIAIQQIKERLAYEDIIAGNFSAAVAKCKNIWASLPGAGYGQHEHKLQFLADVYKKAGGTIA